MRTDRTAIVVAFGLAAAAAAAAAACTRRAQPTDATRPPVEAGPPSRDPPAEAAAPTTPIEEPPPGAITCLARWYGGRAERSAARDGGWALVLEGGVRVPYDDGRAKSAEEKLEAPDIEDMFAARYPTGAITPVLDPASDPGRARIEALFRATYGGSAKEVEAALEPTPFHGQTVRFHRKAAPALRRVGARLDALANARELAPFFDKLGGTFVWRVIAGTDRTSAHAYGIAIDLDPRRSEYWRNSPNAGWHNRVPLAVVAAFEAEGFVWGGRWYHYDTMHFEYRPELFDPSCRP